MPYITYEDYIETYQGSAIDSDSFGRIAMRASEEIDMMTFGRIRPAGLDSFDVDTQASVKLAACSLADALALIDAATDGTGIVTSSEKVGSYSFTTDAASLNGLLIKARARARSYLMPTGLLYAGI
ncbi:MAG: hypothetical protein EOM54_11410 [Clostridia bacterium]|nr:hypothetical protein [Clostridia bacterium]